METIVKKTQRDYSSPAFKPPVIDQVEKSKMTDIH